MTGMDAEKHLQRAREIDATLAKVHPDEADVAAVVELAYGAAHQYAAAYLLRQHDDHHDKHQGVARALEQRGRLEAAEAFQRLTVLRAGRWYGGKGNGKVIRECLELLDVFRRLVQP